MSSPAAHADSASILIGDSTGHPKPQSAALFGFGGKEWFKYPFSMLGRNARPVVGYNKTEFLSQVAICVSRVIKLDAHQTVRLFNGIFHERGNLLAQVCVNTKKLAGRKVSFHDQKTRQVLSNVKSHAESQPMT